MTNKKLIFLLYILLVILVFKSWFFPGIVVGGDLWMVYESIFENYSLIPLAWSQTFGNGIGQSIISIPWLSFPTNLPIVLGKTLNLNWGIIERIFYLFPLLFLNFYSSYSLGKKILKNELLPLITSLLFLFNTYSLMVIGGGQVFVGIAYSLLPLVLLKFIENIEAKKFSKNTIISGLFLGLQMLIDIRIGYITLVSVLLYVLLFFHWNKKNIVNFFNSLLLPLLISILLNAFWVLPTLFLGRNPINELGAAYSSEAAVKFLSFAKIENSISLLHPNWPENIFGKVYFMKPEFLILPLLAFSSLLFINDKNYEKNSIKKSVLYFCLIGLIGIFLAKGSNYPFGIAYIWMFENIPGFNTFRDSTKWYTLIALSYSVLIPFSISCIYKYLYSKTNKTKLSITSRILNLQNVFSFAVIGYILFLIFPALTGQLGGTLQKNSVPQEYYHLETFLNNQNDFFRLLYFPTINSFSYSSTKHPGISAQNYFNKYDALSLSNKISDKKNLSDLQNMSVKYVVLIDDPTAEVFLKDRKYDRDKYLYVKSSLDETPWLKKVNKLGSLTIYEVPTPKEHFWSNQDHLGISYNFINSTKYELHIKNARSNENIVFAENFDHNWMAKDISGSLITSREFNNNLNSFKLTKDGDYKMEIFYRPQNLVNIGLSISIVTLAISLGILIIKRR